MLTFSLQSGSNGNCVYVEAGDARLLIDAGISGREAEGRMRVRNREIRDVDALLITHDHNDHVRCSGVLHRKFHIPIWMTRPTHDAVQCNLGPLRGMNYFTSGQTLQFKNVLVHTIATPHDAADGVGFVIEHAGKRLGILTDLGHPFEGLKELLASLDAVYLESSYDPEMLQAGPYPFHVKQRIVGPHGHLSNYESADLLSHAGRRLEWAALSHLSAVNNAPPVAMETHQKIVGKSLPLYIASRDHVGDILHI